MRICIVDGCEGKHRARGWCEMHYKRWTAHGDLEVHYPKPHGHAGGVGGRGQTPTYQTWAAMKRRCNNPNATGYENYGGRGITVDPRWDTYPPFLEDMGEKPEGLTIDRIDNDGNYTKENCRWADALTQRHNRRKP